MTSPTVRPTGSEGSSAEQKAREMHAKRAVVIDRKAARHAEKMAARAEKQRTK